MPLYSKTKKISASLPFAQLRYFLGVFRPRKTNNRALFGKNR